MGTREDHWLKIRHIGAEARNYTARSPQVPTKAFLEDVFYCAEHLLDAYLAGLHIHPADRDERLEVVERLHRLVEPALSHPLADYYLICDAVDEARGAAGALGLRVSRLDEALQSLQYFVLNLTKF